MRVLIVDDEPLARRGLRNELTTIPDVDCVGECETCDAAVAAISSLAPDLVLLDVKLGRTTGFDALSRLDRDAMPLVVFVSAYDRHALAAFDVRAVDYVLKPVDPARLRAAIDRARETLALRRAATLGDRLEQLLARTRQEADDAAEGAPKMSGRIAIPDGNRVSFVDVAAIDWIEARGNYVRIHTGARPYLLRTPLRDIGNRLRAEAARGAGPGFVQVRRSALVNTAAIVAIERFSKGMYSITLRSGVRITSSRRHREGIRDLIESPGREAPARERS